MPEKSLLDYWIILYRKKYTIGCLILVSIITSVVLSKTIEPVYEAKSSFYIPETSQALPYLTDKTVEELKRKPLMPQPKEETYSSYMGVLKSKKIAEYVQKEYPTKKINKLMLSDVDFDLTNEYFINVYSRDKDPQLAANVANAYVKYINVFLQETSLENLKRDSAAIKAKMEDTKVYLSNIEKSVSDILAKNNIASVDEEIKRLTEQRVFFINQLETKNVLLNENKKRLNELYNELKKEGLLFSKQNATLTNPLIEHLQMKLSEVSAQIMAGSVVYTKKHPELMKLQSQYDQLSESLRNETNNLIASQIKPSTTFYERLRQDLINLAIEKSSNEASVAGYKIAVENADEKLNRLPAIKTRLDMLYNDAEKYKKRVEQLELSYEETIMQMNRDVQFVVLVDRAEVPKKQIFPVLWLNAVVALMVGVIVSIVYVFFVDYIESAGSIRTRKLLQELLNINK
ncbi:MAG: hypothetical protein L3V56_10205 [Candidatus Magnetoovum sp. WYHC-5]|nr:hypothetical protein [Candidatus Magnetoovum sp. WYHC-5]